MLQRYNRLQKITEMRKLKFSIIFLLCLALVGCYRTLGTISVDFPANTYTLAALPTSTSIDLVLNWTIPLTIGISLDVKLTKVGNSSACFQSSATTSPASFNFVTVESGSYSVQVTTYEGKVIPYRMLITAGGPTRVIENVGTSYNFGKGIYLVNILRTCTDLRIQSSQSSNYDYFNYVQPSDTGRFSNVDQTSFSQPSAASISTTFAETGVYYMIPHSMAASGLSITSSATINFNCYDATCGNGIKEGSEECDNGNTVGCLDCVADPSYSCGGALTTPCTCWLSRFDYDIINKQCVIHCEAVPFATNILEGQTDQCECQQNYYFHHASYSCILNCSNVAGSNGVSDGSGCTCLQGYYFDQALQSCVLNCTAIPHAIGYDTLRNIHQCKCQQQYTFDQPTLSCVKIVGKPLTSVEIGLIAALCIATIIAVTISIIALLRCKRIPILNQSTNLPNSSSKIKEEIVFQR